MRDAEFVLVKDGCLNALSDRNILCRMAHFNFMGLGCQKQKTDIGF